MQALSTKMTSRLIQARFSYFARHQNYATRKRFYRNTGIMQNENKWEVTLDHRRLKTPAGKVLAVDSEALARALAAEWDAQAEHVTQPTMHLSAAEKRYLPVTAVTTPEGFLFSAADCTYNLVKCIVWHNLHFFIRKTALCNTALDNPGKLTKHDIANYLLDFLPTDTLLFHSEEEEELKKLQEKKWTPVLEWFQKRFNVTQEVSRGLELPPVATDTRSVLARYFLSYDFTALNAINFGMEALKSPILMIACVERHLEPKEVVLLSRLEEEYQLSRWGRVPWAHELGQAELTARVAAALLIVHGATDSHSARAKAAPAN